MLVLVTVLLMGADDAGLLIADGVLIVILLLVLPPAD